MTTDFSLIHETVPASQDEPPHPALLLLHGRGSNEQDLLPLGQEIDPRLWTVSARAPYIFGPGSFYWYDLEASLIGRPSHETIEYSLDLIETFIGEALKAYPIDPNRLYIGGFSMGGAMSAALTLMHPEMIAGALIFSGYLPIHANLEFKPQEANELPIFQGHGTFDDVLPIEFARMTRDYLTQTPVSLTYREYPIPHTISIPELQDAKEWMRLQLG